MYSPHHATGWRVVAFTAVLSMATLFATACDSRSGASNSDSTVFRVAVVVPGSTADQGWNYSAKEAADLINAEMKLAEKVTFLENVESSQMQSVLRDLARDGYALVLCHGYEFHQPVKEVAPDFLKTSFVISGYDQSDPHFGSIVYQLGEAAYLCGAAASQISETGHVGFIAAMAVPPVVLCYEGYRNGFLDHRPDGSVGQAVYIEGSQPWEDSAAAKAKTQALLRLTRPKRVDVLFQNADAASRGIFEAVEEHGEPIYVFGANRDQNATSATSKIPASAVIHVDQAFLRVARAVKAGTYTPRVESETLASGVIECVLHPELDSMLGTATAGRVRDVIDQAREGIISGAIDPYAK